MTGDLLERTHGLLCILSLTTSEGVLESHLETAARKEAPYAEFLHDLLLVETEARRLRLWNTRMKLAHLPYVKKLSDFDFSFQPNIDERQLKELATLGFVHEANNIILLGPPGVGKTHIAVGLAIEAISGGHGAYFVSAYDLVADLTEAMRQGRLKQRMAIYLRPKVLVIDEVGYLPLDALGATIFFQIVTARYERGSIILTSNKSYADWGSFFGDQTIATAILDRLLHHATTINIRGESYRLKDRRRAGLAQPIAAGPMPRQTFDSEALENQKP
jgi:DNA replication protein DnaC